MADEQSVITAELMEQIEVAAVSAARDVISGRRIVDVEGPYGLGLTTLEVGNEAGIAGGVLVSLDVGSIVLGQDLQISHLSTDAAHEHFSVSESLVLKIEAPDAICVIPGASRSS